MSKPLRAVGPDEKAVEPRKLTLTQAVEIGTPREVLMARRDAVVEKMSDCHPRDHHALDRRLEAIVHELAMLDEREELEVGDGGPTPDETWQAV